MTVSIEEVVVSDEEMKGMDAVATAKIVVHALRKGVGLVIDEAGYLVDRKGYDYSLQVFGGRVIVRDQERPLETFAMRRLALEFLENNPAPPAWALKVGANPHRKVVADAIKWKVANKLRNDEFGWRTTAERLNAE
jgi:hypothetical protein